MPFQLVSDFGIRASYFRPMAGFGFVFSNRFISDTDPFGFAQDKLTPINAEKEKIVNRNSKIVSVRILHSKFTILHSFIHSTTGNTNCLAHSRKISARRRSLSTSTRSATFGPARTGVLSPFGHAQDKLRRRIYRGMNADFTDYAGKS